MSQCGARGSDLGSNRTPSSTAARPRTFLSRFRLTMAERHGSPIPARCSGKSRGRDSALRIARPQDGGALYFVVPVLISHEERLPSAVKRWNRLPGAIAKATNHHRGRNDEGDLRIARPQDGGALFGD